MATTAFGRNKQLAREAQLRYKARLRGEHIPFKTSGWKQSPEHIEKRKRFGSNHPNWIGEAISEKGGRSRALRWYPEVGPCISCGKNKAERHHVNGDTSNNDPSNIKILCRKCHMVEDGRLGASIQRLNSLWTNGKRKRAKNG